MTVSIEFIYITIGLLITIATFLYSRFREAESRGRLLQRIDQLEKDIKSIGDNGRNLEEKIGCHDNDITKITAEIESLKALMERMDKKLDRVLEQK